MSNTSWQVKANYNKKAYRSFSTQIKPDLFDRIDAYCKSNNISRSEFLNRAITLLETHKE